MKDNDDPTTKGPLTGAARNDADVRNYPPLRAWLEKVGAEKVSSYAERPRARLEVWRVGRDGAPFVLRLYAQRMGWEMLTAPPINNVDATLADAELRLGLV